MPVPSADPQDSPTPAALADADPLGLIAHASAARQYASGRDVWEIWVCEVPEDADDPDLEEYGEERVEVDVARATATLERSVVDYYDWLSGGAYDLAFEPGGTFEIDPDVDAAEEACVEAAVETAIGGHGTAVVIDLAHDGGFAEERRPCTADCTIGSFPDNGRLLLVGALAVVGGTEGPPVASTVAHEVGHVLEFPHSFVNEGTGADTEYNNPLDAMSHELFESEVDGVLMSGGTLAVNRYAAGWIGPDQVAVHEGGTATYEIVPIGHDGIQLLAVRSMDPRAFVAIDVRVQQRYDSALAVEGVTVHAVDQRPGACPEPVDGVCSGVRRRHQQLPPNPHSHDHVLQSETMLETVGLRIEVLERDGDVFTVRVTGTADFPTLDPGVQ